MRGGVSMATWEEMASTFSRVTDTLGTKIDAGIFDTVVALNMLGIPTKQSCEGHLDWGVPYPWVALQGEKEHCLRLYRYLSAFYAQHPLSLDTVLILHGIRLCSNGARFHEHFSGKEREQKLRQYQDEMQAFTQFLKTLCSAPDRST